MKSKFVVCLAALVFYGCPFGIKKPKVSHCPDVDINDAPMTVRGFDFQEIDTIRIKTFKKNAHFSEQVDEFLCFQRNTASPVSIELPRALSTAYDWQIIIADTMLYAIDSITVTSEPHMPVGYECEMTAYHINGVAEEKKNLEIWKPGTNSQAKYVPQMIRKAGFSWPKEKN
jgi:hypothetical protein